jgi:hypothetical protein
MNDLEPIGQILPQVLQDLFRDAESREAAWDYAADREPVPAGPPLIDDDDIPGYGNHA